MKLGVCTDIKNAQKIKALGFEEIELSCGYIYELDRDKLDEIIQIKKQTGIKTSVVNCLMAGTAVKLFEEDGIEKSRLYLIELVKKLSLLQVKIVVFGSGGYRQIPDDVSHDVVVEKISEYLEMLCSIMDAYGITVVIEPLNKKECNVLTTTSESMEYIKKLNLPNLMLLVDYYHFELENEPVERIGEYKNYIKHMHIATPVTRAYMTADDDHNYSEFVNAISEVPVILSLEGKCEDFDQEIEKVAEFYKKTNFI